MKLSPLIGIVSGVILQQMQLVEAAQAIVKMLFIACENALTQERFGSELGHLRGVVSGVLMQGLGLKLWREVPMGCCSYHVYGAFGSGEIKEFLRITRGQSKKS